MQVINAKKQQVVVVWDADGKYSQTLVENDSFDAKKIGKQLAESIKGSYCVLYNELVRVDGTFRSE